MAVVKRGQRSMGGRSRVLRASLGAVLFMGFIWFLFVGVLANRAMKTTTITAKSSELLKLIGTQRHHSVRLDCDPYYVSKRRVPNGPDPIHNSESGPLISKMDSCDMCCTDRCFHKCQRAGKYREPPGRV